MRQLDLLYEELTRDVLRDVENMILRAGGNFQTASAYSGVRAKSFYKYMSGACSFSTSLIIHRKISEAVANGVSFKRRRAFRKPKQEIQNGQTEDQGQD